MNYSAQLRSVPSFHYLYSDMASPREAARELVRAAHEKGLLGYKVRVVVKPLTAPDVKWIFTLTHARVVLDPAACYTWEVECHMVAPCGADEVEGLCRRLERVATAADRHPLKFTLATLPSITQRMRWVLAYLGNAEEFVAKWSNSWTRQSSPVLHFASAAFQQIRKIQESRSI